MEQIERYPVYLNPNTIAVITIFVPENGLEDIWTIDYIDHIKESKFAAKQFVAQFTQHVGVRFLQDLREALANEIDSHNAEFGTNFSHDSE